MSEDIFTYPIELPEGVSGAELEKFWVEEFLPKEPKLPGMKNVLYKSYQGKRTDQYLYITYFESSARQRELFPTPGDPTGNEEIQQWFADPVVQKFFSFVDFDHLMATYSNYAEIK